ncbi:hypothetical protein DMENIID0001_055460 [Sergentomyia squamirostris]
MFKFLILASLAAVVLAKSVPTPHDFIYGIDGSLEGRLGPNFGGRVVGGNTASPGQFPYQASLRRASNNEHNCGAVIITNNWLISAAHCTQGSVADWFLMLGLHFRGSGGTRFNIAQIVNHPQYNPSTIANDVSVIRTQTTIAFTNLIQPIAMGSTFVGGGATAVVSGWGLTSSPGSLANQLQFLHVQTLTNEVCRTRVGGSASMVFDHKICAGGVVGQGVCSADSGGPLALGNAVIGIVSWGIPCARGFPDAYDRVASHRSWFLQHIN